MGGSFVCNACECWRGLCAGSLVPSRVFHFELRIAGMIKEKNAGFGLL